MSGAIPQQYDMFDDEDRLISEKDLNDLWEALAELQRRKNRLETREGNNPDPRRRGQILALENKEMEIIDAIEVLLPSVKQSSSSASGSGHASGSASGSGHPSAPAHYPPVPQALQRAVSTPAPASKKDDDDLNSTWITINTEAGCKRQSLGFITEELYKRINPNTGSRYTREDLNMPKQYKTKEYMLSLLLQSERQHNRLQSTGSNSVKIKIKY